MYKLNPFSKWFWSLFTPLLISPIAASFAVNIGSKLFGSLFGGGGAPEIPPEAQFAREVLAAFASGDDVNQFKDFDLTGFEGSVVGKRAKGLSSRREKVLKAAGGLFPEQDILQKAFSSITSRINRQKEGATARAASLGIKPGSGLAENLRSGIQRGEAEAFGKTRSAVSIAKANARRSALNALLGLPSIPQGIDTPNVIAQGGQDLSQLLLLKDFLKS